MKHRSTIVKDNRNIKSGVESIMLCEKEEKYIELVKEIKECHICQNIKAPPYCEDGECLINDSHGIIPGRKITVDNIYVNRWNMWQGSLGADIMVIGLDFGKIAIGDIDRPEEHRWWKNSWQSDAEKLLDWKSPTDRNMYRIFKDVFGSGFILTERCDKLFFTNVACCYRQNRTSGEANDAWYSFCAGKYLGKLIKIIEPKLIICLGLRAFEALGCCENGRIICTGHKRPEGKMPLKELLDAERAYRFELQLGDMRFQTTPVFHPGTNRNRNRTVDQERKDWERAYKLYEMVKMQ